MFSIAGALSSIPYVLATVGVLLALNGLIENPMIRKEARAGYVQETTVAAFAEANAELRRQAKESKQLADAWQKSLERYQDQAEANLRASEEKEAAYVANPANADKCVLTDSDVDFLH